MNNIIRITVAAFALASLAMPANAAITLVANLDTAQEPPPVLLTLADGTTARPTPFGTGTFILNDAQTSLSYNITVFNIDVTGSQTADVNDNLRAAHIHGGLNIIPTAPVVFGFFGTPFNENSPNDVLLTPFATGVGGTVTGKWDAPEGAGTTLAAQLPNILGGRTYVNFHTEQNRGGEIRGTLVALVPEPSTWAMMLLGFGAVGCSLRRRKFRYKPSKAV